MCIEKKKNEMKIFTRSDRARNQRRKIQIKYIYIYIPSIVLYGKSKETSVITKTAADFLVGTYLSI